MRGTYSIGKRFLAMLICVAMVAAYLPGMALTASAAGNVATVADPETLTRPETIYGDSTVNAGKITVGKSVSDKDVTVNGQRITVDGDNNFLVTISQSAQVMGLTAEVSVPLDVVIVFDTSGSMGNDSNRNGKNRTQELVEAANGMIKTLMEMNDLNRVGVVAFSAHNAGGGTAGYNAANVLSELAHYDGEAATEHLTWAQGTGPSWAPSVQLVRGRSTTGNQRNSRYGTGGATNIQAGVTLGAQMLTAADTTVEINGQQITRMPIMILMSDGAPTVSAYENQWWNASQTNNQGPTNAPFMGNGFLTVLTASHYKNEITRHYYGTNPGGNACSFYTVGVELSDQATQDTVQEVDLSYMTLNPSEEFAAGSDNYYYDRSVAEDSFLDAWNSYRRNEAFKVRVWSDQTRHDGYYYFYNKATTIQNANDHKNGSDTWTTLGRVTVQPNILDSVTTLHYNDEFYDVTDVSQLTGALDKLLTEIARKAITVPTKVTTGDHDFDGYVTFTDPIGEYMEVKDMKGVLAGGYFYQGATFAQKVAKFGSAQADTEFDQLLTEVLHSRMHLTDSVIDFNDFAQKALASENQAYYKNANDYDNSIVWWGNAYDSGEEDEQVQVIGFADNDTIEYIETQKAANAIPAGADYVCRSYFFYGEAGGANPDPEHAYLYFMVRVQRELTAPYRETVVISAPASLLSMEKVLINESFDENGNPVYTAEVEHQEPARVVYEVGLWDTINAENVSQIVSRDYAEETVNGSGSANYDAATGTYRFFTNDWDRSQSLDSHHRAQAKATFDAAEDNAFYTYQRDTLLVDANGNPVTAKPAGTTAYYIREYYEWPADSKQDGTYSAVKKTQRIEVDLPIDAQLTEKDGKWYIPAGVYTAATLVVNGDDTVKDDPATQQADDGNKTGTSSVVAHPHRTGGANNSHYTVFLGNNGMLSLVADPYEPTKTVSVNLPTTATNIVDDEGKAVRVGDVLTYTVEVKNTLAEAADITVSDYVPLGTAFVAGSAGSGTDDTGHTRDASIQPDSNNILTWVLKDVPAGQVRYVSFQVTVTKAALSLSAVPDTIDNTATVRLENGPTVTTNTTHNPPYGKSVTDLSNQDIDGEHGYKVGDVLVYHIRFHNNARDAGGNFVAADVTVTDQIPAGTTFLEADNGGTYSAGTVTWTFDDMAAGTSKVVSFQVKINASAKAQEVAADQADGIEPATGEIYLPNAAIIVVDNDPDITLVTNTTENWADVGNMVIRKEVAAGGDQTKVFTIRLTESTGMLSGKYPVSGGNAAYVEFTAGKGTVAIKHGQTLTVQGLPAGVIISVEEDAPEGWTPAYNTRSVTIVKGAATTVSSVSVTNTYTLQPLTVTVKGVKNMNSNLPARTTFGFVAVPDSSNPVVGAPLTGEVTVQTSGAHSFTLSPKTFARPGVYKYTVSEISGGAEGITYDTTEYALVITVTDNGDGTMKAEATLDGSPFSLTGDAVSFTNSYTPKDVELTLVAQKNLKVYNAATGTYTDGTPEAGKFRFQIARKDTGNVVSTGVNAADGKIAFNTIYFSEEMLGGAASKTFTYVVSEVVPELVKDPNMGYDTGSYEITVTLSKNADGTLRVAVGSDTDGNVDTGITFVNYANPDSVSVTPFGVKTTKGSNLPVGLSFSFKVVPVDGGADAATGSSDATVGGGNSETENITFTSMVYTHESLAGEASRTVRYWIMESNASAGTVTGSNGVTYDNTRYLYEVTVSRDAFNKLAATEKYYGLKSGGNATDPADYTLLLERDEVTFENRYAAETFINLTASKQLTGRTPGLKANEFDFVLNRLDASGKLVSGSEITGTNNAAGLIHFATLNYSSAMLNDAYKHADGAFYFSYLMHEIKPEGVAVPGVTYDTEKYVVTVKLTQTVSGLSAELAGVSKAVYTQATDSYAPGTPVSGFAAAGNTNVTFTNTYVAVEGDVVKYQIRKDLQGRDVRAGEFEFGLYLNGRLEDIATNDENGIVTFFRTIPATAASHQGMYEMVIKEFKGAAVGVSYSQQEFKVYVNVQDNGQGKIEATVHLSPTDPALPENADGMVDLTGDIVFVNTYTPGDVPVQLEATKTLTGRNLEDKEFSFVVRQNNSSGKIVASGSNDASGNILFSTFDITAADMAGQRDKTFVYAIMESHNQEPGVAVDETVFYATVAVHDDGSGMLSANVNYTKNSATGAAVQKPEFVNVYTPDSVKLPLTAYKTLTGKKLAANEFTFELKNAAGKVIQTVKNDANGAVTFEDLVFTAADMVDGTGKKLMTKDFVYTVTEKSGSVATGTMQYDGNVYTVTVTVTDDGNGALTAKATYTDNSGAAQLIRFTNTYTPATAQVVLRGSKAIVDAEGKAIHSAQTHPLSGFTFAAYDTRGNEAATGTSDDQGNIVFSTLQFTAAGEYRFLIREKATTKPGYSTDGTIWCAHITIRYNENTGILYEDESVRLIHVAPESHEEGIASQVSQGIEFVNVYDPADVSLTLKVKKDLEGRELHDHEFTFRMVDHDTGLLVAETRNHANGDVNLHLSYTKAGDYEYTIYELTPAQDEKRGGVTYSQEKYKVEIQVTDDGSGALKAQVGNVTVLGADTVDLSDTVIFHNTYAPKPVDVFVEAQKLLDGKTLDADAFTFELVNKNNAAERYTATNAADGKITFEKITFTAADTYTYTLSEVEGTAAGVTYDKHVYTVTVVVTDDGNGNLHAVLHYTNSDGGTEAVPVFHNTYAPKPVDYAPVVKKVFEGGEMRSFDFVLSGEGFETQTKQNDAEGNVAFDKLTFHNAGSYTFTVHEQVDQSVDDIRWDENVYTLQIEVKDNSNGQLVVESVSVTSAKGRTDLVFHNVHKDIITEKTVDKQVASVGETLTYTVSYTNKTGAVAKVVITDKLDSALTYVEGSADTGVYADGVITWTVAEVAADETVTVSFQAKIKMDTEQDRVVNVAEVYENQADVVTTNEVVTQLKEPALTIHKQQSVGNGKATTDKLAVEPKDVVTYYLTVTNTGEGTACGITVSDQIPAGLKYVEKSADQGGKEEKGAVSWQIESLAPGKSVTLSFQVTVPEVEKNTTWTNVGTVVYENNPDGADKVTESNKVQIEAKVSVTPETGDSFNIPLFISLMVLSSFGLAAVVVSKKREEAREEAN